MIWINWLSLIKFSWNKVWYINLKIHIYLRVSMVVQRVKRLPAMWETWVWSLGWEDPLEKEMATHSSILAWRTPGTEEPGRLQSMGSKESDMTERLHFQFSKNYCISGYIFSRFSNKCSGSLFSIYLLYLLNQLELSRKTDPVRCLCMYVCMSLSICLFIKERENFLAIGFQDWGDCQVIDPLGRLAC